MIYIRIFLLWIITFFITLQTRDTPIHVLFFVDTLMSETKSIIINQALGLLDKGFCVSILAQKQGDFYDATIDQLFSGHMHYGPLTDDIVNSVDVIICQYGTLGKECAAHLHKHKKKIKFITFFRGADITSTKETQINSYDLLFSMGDLFMPVCAYYAYLLEILGCDPQKILVQPSGINCSLFQFRNKTPDVARSFYKSDNGKPIRLISVGRLIEKKGIKDAIKAISSLIHEGYNIEYTIIGDGKQKKYLSKLTQQLGIEQNVHFLGRISNKEIATLLQDSHIFILPSVTCPDGSQEGIPNALKEAMATGLPVISTYHAGIRELIKHEKSGLLTPERDIDSLMNNIKYLIHHPKNWPSMTALARETVETHYDIKYLNHLLAERIRALVKTSD